jgi:hypothetical protein
MKSFGWLIWVAEPGGGADEKLSLTKPKGANGPEIRLEWDKFAKEA